MESKKNIANIIARECILEALLKLIKIKPLSSITITELTKLAGVSRMTFYRNYESKEEVFISHLDNILEMYELEEQNATVKGTHYYDLEPLRHCFQYFAKYREFLDGMFQCGFGNIFLEKLTDYVLKKWGNEEINNNYELYSFAGSLYNLYIKWTSEMPLQPIDDVIVILNHIYDKKI